MPSFCRVDGERAGPNALGILMPPGRRTLVILRPRSLDCDLVPVRAGVEGAVRPTWEEMGRDEAARLAESLPRALQDWASSGAGIVEPIAMLEGDGYQVRAVFGLRVWLACRRLPGQAYQPVVFATENEAQQEARRLAAILFPPENGNQELYFNTRQFSR